MLRRSHSSFVFSDCARASSSRFWNPPGQPVLALCAAHPLLPGFFFFCWGNSASNPPPPCRRFGVRNGPPFSQGCPNSPTSGSRMSSYRARRQGGDSKWRVSETAHVADYPGVSRRRTRPRIEDAAAGQFGGAETSCMLQISPPPPPSQSPLCRPHRSSGCSTFTAA